jgi:general transcriptional corepressor TUP1
LNDEFPEWPKSKDLYIRTVCFSPDGQYLATGGEDKEIKIWNIESKMIANRYRGHEDEILRVAFSSDGTKLASGAVDKTVRLWYTDGECLFVLSVEPYGVTNLALSPDGRILAAGTMERRVFLWDTTSGVLLALLESGHKDGVYAVAFSPNGHWLLSASLDKTMKLWELERRFWQGGRRSAGISFEGHQDFVLSSEFTPDGKWIVSGSKDHGVQFWDPVGVSQCMLVAHTNPGTRILSLQVALFVWGDI